MQPQLFASAGFSEVSSKYCTVRARNRWSTQSCRLSFWLSVWMSCMYACMYIIYVSYLSLSGFIHVLVWLYRLLYTMQYDFMCVCKVCAYCISPCGHEYLGMLNTYDLFATTRLSRKCVGDHNQFISSKNMTYLWFTEKNTPRWIEFGSTQNLLRPNIITNKHHDD